MVCSEYVAICYTTATIVVLQVHARTLDHPVMPIYAVFVILWSSALLVLWRQRCSELAYRYRRKSPRSDYVRKTPKAFIEEVMKNTCNIHLQQLLLFHWTSSLHNANASMAKSDSVASREGKICSAAS